MRKKIQWKLYLHPSFQTYSNILLILFFLFPLAGYMAWTGNRGYFFDYYITSHFIFMIPLFILCCSYIWNTKTVTRLQSVFKLLIVVTFFGWIIQTGKYISDFIFYPVNNAGLHKIEQAIDQLYSWKLEVSEPTAMLVFTPAYQNEQYDYLIWWKAKTNKISQPPSVRQGSERNWFLLIEKNSSDISKFRFQEWYPTATAGGILKERKQIGILELEWWQKSN